MTNYIPFLPYQIRRINAKLLALICNKPLGKHHRKEETILYKMLDVVHYGQLTS